MSNQLANQSSPYLLQHKDNPVDWYPWDSEALARAKDEDKPIFLSIGYSACHWCHVMEHESFENEEIARQLNERFVCIKVDREERPDLDQIYMNAVMMMTGQGGWPMSVFLTPDLQPFYAGTYWPPTAASGRPGFDQVIQAVANAWDNQRQQIREQASQLAEQLRAATRVEGAQAPLKPELLHTAATRLEQVFDFTYGGFGQAPKFPHTMDLQVLLRVWRRHPREGLLEMVRLSLDKMARGGIHDHLAGGFARYAVDARWLVPHFEKMLYDNALLTGIYLDSFLVTRDPLYAQVAQQTADYVLTWLRDDQGAFHSSEDADSEGEEGKFYVWSAAEVRSVLGAAAERFCYVYDVTDGGNWEGNNVLNLPKSIEKCATLHEWEPAQLRDELSGCRARLLEVRNRRVRPAKDDKVLVSWNALMIDSLARAAGILNHPQFLTAAREAATFILENMRRADGRLLHTWRRGKAQLDAYLDDYSCLVQALVSLYEAEFDEHWIDEAVRLAEIVLRHFADEAGGFFYTADDHEQLIARPKESHDGSVPSGNSMAATALLRLGRLCGRHDFLQAAQGTLENALAVMERSPTAAGQMLVAADLCCGPAMAIVILGPPEHPDTAAILADLRQRFLPSTVVALRASADAGTSRHLDPIFAGRQIQSHVPTVFVCQDFVCQAPVAGREAVLAAWNALEGGRSER